MNKLHKEKGTFMKKSILLIFFSVIVNMLFSALFITRNEADIITKELYHDNYFAELHNDAIVSIWDFNEFELTLINHSLRVYTCIDFESFKATMQRQNQAQIEKELQSIDNDRQKMIVNATLALYNTMKPRFMLVDTLRVHGFKAFEFHVYNGNIISQKLWISKDLQEKINTEVNYESIQLAENILKENRENYFKSLGIRLDPISVIVEDIEKMGYVTKRIDYGLRDKIDPIKDKEIESQVNEISYILESKIDPDIFTFHKNYRKLSYNDYQMMMIREAEKRLE